MVEYQLPKLNVAGSIPVARFLATFKSCVKKNLSFAHQMNDESHIVNSMC